MDKMVVGILAHVDAGKTTLAEALLFLSGKLRKPGRVDNGDAYLDTFTLEKERGITIFSKQALIETEKSQIILMDTPGHVDFSAEMERTLQVLDYAILVISGADGVQGHSKTLWRLLAQYQIPTFIFINKMDQNGTDRERLMKELKQSLSDGCIDFGEDEHSALAEQLAVCDERILDVFLETGKVEKTQITQAVRGRRVFPCFFGSALKFTGVAEFFQAVSEYMTARVYPDKFGAKVFKITRSEQGGRLTHMKITGGALKVRDTINGEKVSRIRIYSGVKYETQSEVPSGSICAVEGLTLPKVGDGLGEEDTGDDPVLSPVLSYQIILPEGCDPKQMLPKLRQLEEEEPELCIIWEESLQEIQAKLMGEVQMEVLQHLIKERFDVDVAFGEGRIVYRETIKEMVEGVGHFEPLRHYAEVHLLLEPGQRGSGLHFSSSCSEDLLDKNWQRLILTHLREKEHRGVLTGAQITDMKITLAAGKAHKKHTEGGDFREATYRAVRQGLMEAESLLLEPFYSYRLDIPEKMVGRAMTDIDKMHGSCQVSHNEGERAVLTGNAPVSAMRNYHKDVISYSRGDGRLFCTFSGYEECHNAEEVCRDMGYNPESDIANPPGSVFCSQGAGYLVSWDHVKEHMHLDSCLRKESKEEKAGCIDNQGLHSPRESISLKEIERIMQRTFYSNKGDKSAWKKRIAPKESTYTAPRVSKNTEIPTEPKEEYLLVDAYNVIFAWQELKELAENSMDSAKEKLLDELCKYQYIRGCRIIAVFDAYRVSGHREEKLEYNNIWVVYTREAQTADSYIERYVHENHKRFNITVATSDGLEQIIIRGSDSLLLSARELKEEIYRANEWIMQEYERRQKKMGNPIIERLPEAVRERLEEIQAEDGD